MADTIWTTVKVRRSLLGDAAERWPGTSNAQIIDRALRGALEQEPNTSASSGGGIASQGKIPGESGRGAMGDPPGAREADEPSLSGVKHASAPTRTSNLPAGPLPSPPDEEPSSALTGRDGEVGSHGDGAAALEAQGLRNVAENQRMMHQMTVEEAITRCPVCNDALDEDRRCVDPECRSHRVPA